MKQFAVIGLGSFGENIAKYLTAKGAEVLVIDINEERIKDISQYVTNSIVADVTEEKALKDAGISDFQTVIVALGEPIEASIMTTLLLKELGVKTVIVKALSPLHGKILAKVGADKVIFPEIDMAEKLGQSLLTPKILEEIQLSPDYDIVEIISPESFFNKTLEEIKTRKFGINIIGIKRKRFDVASNGDIQPQEEFVFPEATTELLEGDILVIVGKKDGIEKFKRIK